MLPDEPPAAAGAPAAAPIQFDTHVPATGSAPACAACKQPVRDSYYTAGKAVLCASCKERIAAATPARPGAARVARAALFGIGGAIVAAIIYYVVLRATGYEIALVAIAAGYIVGRAVQLGAGGQRGRIFQIMAVVLTYIGIAAGYTPEALKGLDQRSATASVDSTAPPSSSAAPLAEASPTKPITVWAFMAAAGALVGVALLVPVFATFGGLPVSLLTGVIIAVGLRQAWVMNGRAPAPVFHGPFRVSVSPAGPAA
jgi:hypothetical protein